MSLTNSSAIDGQSRSVREPILCYVTDRHSLAGSPQSGLFEPLLQRVEELAAAGIDWIQLREKDLSGRACASLAHEALSRVSKRVTSGRRAPRILVNDRVDVAFSERAGGVHLGEDSLPAREVKRLLAARSAPPLSNDFLVGVSCHSLEVAQSAASSGADYILFGPVFATPSKARYGPPQGLERLAEACRSLSIPVLAIGGITLENVSACFSAGSSGIAAIRLFQNSANPAGVVRAIRQQFS